MRLPKKIFIDSSGWISYLLKGEAYHQEVSNYITGEVKNGSEFFTSDYVLDETYTWLLMRQSLQVVRKFSQRIKKAEAQKNLLVVWVEKLIFAETWKYFVKFYEHKLSFTDATIIAFAKELKLDEILTLDRGFSKVGLTTKPLLRK
jgi:predicted nucleic acid-binding protein